MKRILYGIFISLCCFALCSCALFEKKDSSAISTPDSEVTESYLEHTVGTSGETLGLIAEWYTGKVKHWKTIAKHNPSINVRAIKVGQKIKIPQSIVKKKTPLSPEEVAKRLSTGSYNDSDREVDINAATRDIMEPDTDDIPFEEPNIEDAIIDVNISDYERPLVREEPQGQLPDTNTGSEKPSLPFRTYEKRGVADQDSLRFDDATSQSLQQQAPAAQERDPEDVKKLLKSREEYLQQLLEE